MASNGRAALVMAVLVASLPISGPAYAAKPIATDPYTFQNVKIGGTGLVTGIVFSEAQRDLAYARTDVGGAYRWNGVTGQWTPLQDSTGWDHWGYMGVAAIAPSPTDGRKVWAAVGMYTNGVDPHHGAVLRSRDRGATWQTAELPFTLGGNMDGRTMGERLAVDPVDDNVLYLGAPTGNGLWRSGDGGATWARVTSFPHSGDDPQTTGTAEDPGLVWVAFDRSTGQRGGTTKTIYVGVADRQDPVYRSTDGGATWARLAGAPLGYLPHRGVVDPVSHTLYITTADSIGPFGGGKGDVWKYAPGPGVWTQISPVPSASGDDYFGYSGLAIDPSHPGTLVVGTQVSWWPDGIMWRSTDAGATWSRIWDWGDWPTRKLRYTFDSSATPWITMGEATNPPIYTPKIGQVLSSIQIDPFNSDRMLFNGGPGIAGTTNLTDWDTGGTLDIKPVVAGLEEGAVLGLIKPPGGKLISALGDVGGFRHDDLQTSPKTIFTGPVFTTTRSVDFAERNPGIIVRAGDFTDADRPADSHAAFSLDGGVTWSQGSEPGGISTGGSIAAAADGTRFVWAPGDAGQPVVYSTDLGGTWEQSAGVPANAMIASDRVNPMDFYAYDNGTFYVSTDGGATFAASAATGLPATNWGVRCKAVPGRAGDIWVAGGASWTTYGLWHSTDYGASFTRVAGVENADNIGFGKPAPGRSYPTLYAAAQIAGVRGVFRSDDVGGSWVRINDDRHQYGGLPEVLIGDPDIYGRVYLTGYGRGIIYGDRRRP